MGIFATDIAPSVYKSFAWHEPVADNVTFHGWNFAKGIYYFINYIFIAGFGYILLWPLWKKLDQELFIIKLIASFGFAYVCTLPIIRILSFFVTYTDIFWPVWIALIIISGALLGVYEYRGYFKEKVWQWSWPDFNIQLGIVFILSLMVYALLMLQISQSDFHWVGHGVDQYAGFLDEWTELTHFPILKSHYDEWIFHYFLEQGVEDTFNPIIPWWLTLSLIKVSLLCLIYLLFVYFGVARWLSALFALFMSMGSVSLLPHKYYMLFDSSNPLFFTVHSGRLIMFGILFILIWDVMKRASKEPSLSWITIVLCALGITATSISNAAVFIVYSTVIVLFLNRLIGKGEIK